MKIREYCFSTNEVKFESFNFLETRIVKNVQKEVYLLTSTYMK
jgi:hypothetical protein